MLSRDRSESRRDTGKHSGRRRKMRKDEKVRERRKTTEGREAGEKTKDEREA